MKLILLRHGQSEADILKVCEGWANYNLTELGCKQARVTCNYLAENYIFDKIYVSTLNRAIQTAEYLAANTHLSLNKTDELKEFNNGLRAKLPYNEAYAKYPNVPTPIHTSNYEQETELHFRMRAESFLSKVITTSYKSLLLVFIKTFLLFLPFSIFISHISPIVSGKQSRKFPL